MPAAAERPTPSARRCRRRKRGRFFWRTGDQRIIDGLGPDGISARVLDVTRGVVRVQTGYVYHYAFAMLIGVAALVTFYLFRGAH